MSYRDEWRPVVTDNVLLGTRKLIKKTTDTGFDKMKIQFRLALNFNNGVQFGQLKGSSAAAPSPICLASCPPG
jgi:hypothetical protein